MLVDQKLNLINIIQANGFNYYDFRDIGNQVSLEGILTEELVSSILKINPFIDESSVYSLIEEKLYGKAQTDFTNNMFINTLQDGISIKVNKKMKNIKFLDFQDINNNQFSVIKDYCFEKNENKTIIDFIFYVNGLPIVMMEKTNKVEHGLTRLKRCKEEVPIFSICEVFSVITDGFGVKWGIDNSFEDWYTGDNSKISPYDSFVKEMLLPKSLLELIKNYIVVSENSRGSQKYIFKDYQRRAIVKTIHKLITTTEKRVGIINLQFGTGQVLTLLQLVKLILNEKGLNNPKVLVVSDRIDKSHHLLSTFNSIYNLPSGIAQTSDQLNSLLCATDIPIIFTTVQKFREEYKFYDKETIIIVDNCHRSQSGSYALNMRNTIPNARLIGITSSNVTKKMMQLFGEIIDQFTIEDAIKRGLMLPVYYENRVEYYKNITQLDQKRNETEVSPYFEIKKKTQDIINHFNSNHNKNSSRALLFAKNRAEAIQYKKCFDEINGLSSALYMSGNQHDSEETKNLLDNRMEILQRFNHKNGDIRILITCSAIPTTHLIQVVYLDKHVSNNLMQEIIGLVGLKYEDKGSGFIIDYVGMNGIYFQKY